MQGMGRTSFTEFSGGFGENEFSVQGKEAGTHGA